MMIIIVIVMIVDAIVTADMLLANDALDNLRAPTWTGHAMRSLPGYMASYSGPEDVAIKLPMAYINRMVPMQTAWRSRRKDI
jgi:hypothetical protein